MAGGEPTPKHSAEESIWSEAGRVAGKILYMLVEFSLVSSVPAHSYFSKQDAS